MAATRTRVILPWDVGQQVSSPHSRPRQAVVSRRCNRVRKGCCVAMWRLFAAAACLAAGAAMAAVGTLAAGQGDDPFLARARALHLSVPMFDGHNDYPWEVRQRAGKDLAALDIRGAAADTMTDIPRLRRGGVGAQFWSVYVPASLAGQQAVTATLEQIDIVHRMIARYPEDFELALTADDVRADLHGGEDRVAHRHGGRPLDRLLARRAADVRAARRALHDADALEERAVGRLGHRHARARRPDARSARTSSAR